jgi:twitching motility protein PilT
MVAAYEFMVVTPAIANLIRENKVVPYRLEIQTGKKFGMQLLDEHLWNLYMQGKVTPADAIDRSRNPGTMQDKIDAHRRGLDLQQKMGEKKEGEEGGDEDVSDIDTIRT